MAVEITNKKALELVLALAIAGRPFAETNKNVTEEKLDQAIKKVRELWVKIPN